MDSKLIENHLIYYYNIDGTNVRLILIENFLQPEELMHYINENQQQ